MTDVWFAIRGANLNLDEEGNVESVLDAGAVLQIYWPVVKQTDKGVQT